jgi:hypothetical protein
VLSRLLSRPPGGGGQPCLRFDGGDKPVSNDRDPAALGRAMHCTTSLVEIFGPIRATPAGASGARKYSANTYTFRLCWSTHGQNAVCATVTWGWSKFLP